MRNIASNYRFPMISSTWVLLACCNLAHGEYREQWLGKTEIQREASARHAGVPKLAHGTGTAAREPAHASPDSTRTVRPFAEDDPIAAFAETDKKRNAVKLRTAKTARVSS
ncbi:hypothetical protein [Burkholderia vietnamiensis]|uniref:hypothetical protein n=1 Tax=Burkholderia vietnamiensis TaxID=60552 RepID=UPI001CF329B6|nr:hypothetical protein [Burkholderia vietnamiensis]MCA7988253.1 hypothetical protein [Burkholderia vietnamiensis]HDR8934502.1 hypothetical protein [Burkholderia vietnamiensis]